MNVFVRLCAASAAAAASSSAATTTTTIAAAAAVAAAAAAVAAGWTLNSLGYSVGLCDMDLCGPSLPLMLQQQNTDVYQSAEGWEPAFFRPDLCLISIGISNNTP